MTQYITWTLVHLRKELKLRGTKQSGRKNELVERLECLDKMGVQGVAVNQDCTSTGKILTEQKCTQNHATMAPQFKEIQTFVFLDFEGSGLGRDARITELCMVALHRSALMVRTEVHLGRVMDEMTLCVNPAKPIPDIVTKITGLSNNNLSRKKDFDLDTVTMLNGFLRRQQQPVCLVAYNGKGYDFGLLKSELQGIGAELIPSVYCVDPLDFFRAENKIPPMCLWSSKKVPQGVQDNNNGFPEEDGETLCKALDEATGVTGVIKEYGVLFNKDSKKSKISHKQREVYFRTFGKYPAQEHFAKDDCYALAQIFQKFAVRLLPWCDANAVQFEYVTPLYKPVRHSILGKRIFEMRF